MEKCYRLAHQTDTVDVRGDDARDALIHSGYGLVAAIDCSTGTQTDQASPEYVQQGQREREAAVALPEEELRQLRRQVGGVVLQNVTPVPDVSWGPAQAKASD